MKLLHAIFSNPTQLLTKAKADGADLLQAVAVQDKGRARAAIFNFAVTAYHIWDWVKVYRPDLDSKTTNALTRNESLAVCRDLANASKHAVLTVTKGPYKKYPPVVQDLALSVMSAPHLDPSTDMKRKEAILPSDVDSPWRMKVQLTSGRRIAVEVLVRETLTAWEDYFAKHSIK